LKSDDIETVFKSFHFKTQLVVVAVSESIIADGPLPDAPPPFVWQDKDEPKHADEYQLWLNEHISFPEPFKAIADRGKTKLRLEASDFSASGFPGLPFICCIMC
jgi:hypothetical protein